MRKSCATHSQSISCDATPPIGMIFLIMERQANFFSECPRQPPAWPRSFPPFCQTTILVRMADIRRRRRRWSRYMLQGTLLLALLLAIPCSWLAVKMERAERQRAVVEEFENLGGVVWYDYQFDRADIPNAEQAEPPGPPWLRRLLGDDFFTNVTKLDLMQTEIGDAALNDLEVLSELQSLSLGERVSDAGLCI